jgi:uncharacterized protein (UPF0332 family)
MNPRDFLDVADALIEGSSEAEWRSAVSRAYYAAFHIARQLLRQCGFQVPEADQAHAYLWLRLSNCGHPDVQNAGHELKELRTARNWADYDLDRPLDQPAGFSPILAATNVIQLLEAVAAEPAIPSSKPSRSTNATCSARSPGSREHR